MIKFGLSSSKQSNIRLSFFILFLDAFWVEIIIIFVKTSCDKHWRHFKFFKICSYCWQISLSKSKRKDSLTLIFLFVVYITWIYHLVLILFRFTLKRSQLEEVLHPCQNFVTDKNLASVTLCQQAVPNLNTEGT